MEEPDNIQTKDISEDDMILKCKQTMKFKSVTQAYRKMYVCLPHMLFFSNSVIFLQCFKWQKRYWEYWVCWTFLSVSLYIVHWYYCRSPVEKDSVYHCFSNIELLFSYLVRAHVQEKSKHIAAASHHDNGPGSGDLDNKDMIPAPNNTKYVILVCIRSICKLMSCLLSVGQRWRANSSLLR